MSFTSAKYIADFSRTVFLLISKKKQCSSEYLIRMWHWNASNGNKNIKNIATPQYKNQSVGTQQNIAWYIAVVLISVSNS